MFLFTETFLPCRNCARPPLKSVTEKISTRKTTFTSQNKKLVMININGVLYRSSSNKLQVSSARSPVKILPCKPPVDSSNSKQRCLTIRGTRFLLDPSGTKLRKMPSLEIEEPHQAKLGRIDIGGLTYMPKTDGTFVRTDNHRTRSYLRLICLSSVKGNVLHCFSVTAWLNIKAFRCLQIGCGNATFLARFSGVWENALLLCEENALNCMIRIR